MAFHNKNATYVETVSLNIKDLNRSIDFYTKIIGLSVKEQNSTHAELTADGENVLLVLNQVDKERTHRRASGLYHFALLLPTREDLALITMHLAANRIPLGSADHHVSEALYLDDPDGNGIEIYIDREPEHWIWNDGQVHMVTEPLNAEDLLKDRPDPSNFKGLPKDTIMGHIHLHVNDLQKNDEFYTEGLGFEVILNFGGQALFMATEKYHHHIAANIWNGLGAPAPEKGSIGLDYYTVIYPSNEALNKAVSRLTELGFTAEQEEGYVLTADPSGSHIRMQTHKSHN